jgi:hypothetical protein
MEQIVLVHNIGIAIYGILILLLGVILIFQNNMKIEKVVITLLAYLIVIGITYAVAALLAIAIGAINELFNYL